MSKFASTPGFPLEEGDGKPNAFRESSEFGDLIPPEAANSARMAARVGFSNSLLKLNVQYLSWAPGRLKGARNCVRTGRFRV